MKTPGVAVLVFLGLVLELGALSAFAAPDVTLRRDATVADLPNCALPIDYAKIEDGLTTIKNRPEYRMPPGVAGYGAKPSDQPLPEWIAPLMDRVSTAAFGRAGVIPVISAKETHFDGTRIAMGVSPEDVKWLGKFLKKDEIQDGMVFLLAHETGHYVQNLLMSEKYSVTPFLSASSYRLDWHTARAEDQAMLYRHMENGQDHAEVDAIGFTLLKQMGVSDAAGRKIIRRIYEEAKPSAPSKKLTLLQAENTSEGFFAWSDAVIRLQSMDHPTEIDSTRCLQ